MTSGHQLAPDDVPPLTSREYAAAVNEVESLAPRRARLVRTKIKRISPCSGPTAQEQPAPPGHLNVLAQIWPPSAAIRFRKTPAFRGAQRSDGGRRRLCVGCQYREFISSRSPRSAQADTDGNPDCTTADPIQRRSNCNSTIPNLYLRALSLVERPRPCWRASAPTTSRSPCRARTPAVPDRSFASFTSRPGIGRQPHVSQHSFPIRRRGRLGTRTSRSGVSVAANFFKAAHRPAAPGRTADLRSGQKVARRRGSLPALPSSRWKLSGSTAARRPRSISSAGCWDWKPTTRADCWPATGAGKAYSA